MSPVFVTPSMTYRYTIVNVRDMDPDALLASSDWVDNEFAILAKNANKEEVIDTVVPRLLRLQGQEQADAKATFTLLSGIVRLERKGCGFAHPSLVSLTLRAAYVLRGVTWSGQQRSHDAHRPSDLRPERSEPRGL